MTIGFLGAGKMARALATGLVKGGVVTPKELICSSRSPESGEAFLGNFPQRSARWTSDLEQLVRESDLVVLAVKPQNFADVLPPLHSASAGKLFLSLAAGVPLAKMAAWLHPTARIVRAMPNTPMQIGAGASVYAAHPSVTPDDLMLIDRVLKSAGKAWRVEENQIDTITALSGSGPAYVFHFIQALTLAAVNLGLPETLARELAVQTVSGSGQLAAQSSLTPMELAAQVKSPGGTTVAGCKVLETDQALDFLIARCLAAAKNRAEQLARH